MNLFILDKVSTPTVISPTPGKTGLDRNLVVRAGLDLLNEVGLDAFTTRRLAERLGVRQPAIYWHFRNKRDLLDEMAVQMLAEGRQPGQMTGETWRESLIQDMRGFRHALLRYRDGARVHAGTRPGTLLYASLELRTRAMCDAGFTPADAARAFMVASHYVVGSVIEEQAAIHAERPPIADDLFPDPVAQPTLAKAIDVLRHEDESKSFEFGLDALITGFAVLRSASFLPD